MHGIYLLIDVNRRSSVQ